MFNKRSNTMSDYTLKKYNDYKKNEIQWMIYAFKYKKLQCIRQKNKVQITMHSWYNIFVIR